MRLFTSTKVREIDAGTIRLQGITSLDLMERASYRFVTAFVKKFSPSGKVVVVAGPGNNGGDGLAIARMLLERHYDVMAYLIDTGSPLSIDCNSNFVRLKKINPDRIKPISDTAGLSIPDNSILIDAIFGSGLSRVVAGKIAEVINLINTSECRVVSVDIPSGLFGEDNSSNHSSSIVHADFTFTFQFPFLSFFFAENEKYTGKWTVIPIGLDEKVIDETPSSYEYFDLSNAADLLKSRSKFSHKGSYGHALIVAGSYGMMGAAVLASKACLRSGAGLVTAHVPGCGCSIMQSSVPEVIVSVDGSESSFTGIQDVSTFHSIGIGPGLKCSRPAWKKVLDIMERAAVPLVIDAEGLNILSHNKKWLAKLQKNTILTPHPKEFDRLAGASRSGWERYQKQLEFAARYKVIVVMKGAHTLTVLPNGRTIINSSGNPGMATAGTGDVLTGIITSLLAQGYQPEAAAPLGVYIHGLAADLALEHQSVESLIAGDIINNLGKAFKKVCGTDTCTGDRFTNFNTDV
jgi:NAD(P)H-hydrate epimerase